MSTQKKSDDTRLLIQFTELLQRRDLGQLSTKKIRAGLQLIMIGTQNTLVWKDAIDARVYEGVRLTKDFMAQTMEYNGQAMKRHLNGGGWVPMFQDEDDPSMPFVADSVYVGPFAMIYENARAIMDVTVKNTARVCGNANLEGWAVLRDNALVYGNGVVMNNSLIAQNACVSGHAKIQGSSILEGNAHVYGDNTLLHNIHLSGNDRVFGNVIGRDGQLTTKPRFEG